MTVISYAARPSVATTETTYQVSDDALTWDSGTVRNTVPLADVASVRLFTAPSARYRYMGGVPIGGAEMCVVKARDGRTLTVTSKHFEKLAVFEDRSATFVPFVDAVMARVARVNPAAVFLAGMPTGIWWLWVCVAAVMGLGVLFGVLMVVGSAMGAGTMIGLLFGLVFTIGTGLSLRNALAIVKQGRQRTFDPRAATSTG